MATDSTAAVTEAADKQRDYANAPVADRADTAEKNGVTLARHRICRNADGDLVHANNPDAATLAYAAGDVVADDDVDEINDLGDPDGNDADVVNDEPEKSETPQTPATPETPATPAKKAAAPKKANGATA